MAMSVPLLECAGVGARSCEWLMSRLDLVRVCAAMEICVALLRMRALPFMREHESSAMSFARRFFGVDARAL